MLTTHNIGSRCGKPAQQNHKRWITIPLGTFKTATTYLQYILRHNYGTPSGEIYYPDAAIWGDAHHYLVPEFPPWESKRSDRQYAKSWQKLIEAIDRSDAPHIIISSEMFCTFTEAEIQAVGEYLNDFSLRAIIYLRRQDQYYSSLMEQFIKGVHGGKHQYTCLDSTLETLAISSRHNYLDICTRRDQQECSHDTDLDCTVCLSAFGIPQVPVETEEKHAANIALMASQFVLEKRSDGALARRSAS